MMCGGIYEEEMMTEDAMFMSRHQFIELYGSENESIWREQNPNMGDIKFMTAGEFLAEQSKT
jgi:hypothetical protein